MELPAPAWEERVLPARVRPYDPSDLEYLCLSGMITWGRLTPLGGASADEGGLPERRSRRRQAPTRNAPIAFVLRDDLPALLGRADDGAGFLRGVSPAAREIAAFLEARGASFMADIARATRRLPAEVEDALWELVSAGLVSGDGVAGLRRLLHAGRRSRGRYRRLRSLGVTPHARALPVGRWALWRPRGEPPEPAKVHEVWARQLLRRYGVVLRDLLARERLAPSWRHLLEVYRRWEAQGEIRGGRFVAGLVGEQFALPEAVEALRAVRRADDGDHVVVIFAADPLNLVGTLLPGSRLPAGSGEAIAYRGGVPIEVGPPGALLRKVQSGSPRA
jgi:ATP-dependent Lhr-like helicase